MKKRLRLPGPALVISVVALFVALGGTGYAALHLPRNSVGTIQLQNGSVINPKIRNGTILGAKLKNGTVTAGKINAKGLTVPNAIHATVALTAQTAATATTATSAASATTAGSATTAASAGTATVASSAGTLASGKTETGVYSVDFDASAATEPDTGAITFPFALAAPLTGEEWIAANATSDQNCPGSAADPQAAAGYLCVYESAKQNVATRCVADLTGSCIAASKFAYGALPTITAASPGRADSVGTWAVTAP